MGRRCTEGPSQSWRRPLLVPAVNRSRVSASWAHASGVATLAYLVDATLIGWLQGPVLGQVNARISDAANSMAHVPYVHLPMSQAKQSGSKCAAALHAQTHTAPQRPPAAPRRHEWNVFVNNARDEVCSCAQNGSRSCAERTNKQRTNSRITVSQLALQVVTYRNWSASDFLM